MKYLRIASVSRTNSTDMFTLGVSTSRGTDKIGQFGSGSLMGSLCWMRHEGDSPIFGLNGLRVEFECQLMKKTDGQPFRQVFKVENGEKTPLSVCLEYGEVDWVSPEMGLREWISNALDHGADLSEALTVVDESEIDFPEEMVVVYVPMSGTVRKYWQNIDKYFLHFLDMQTVPAIKKEKSSPCRVYRRGVFVRELEVKTIFDYNLDFDINESRTGSSDSIREKIQRFSIGNGDVKTPPEYVRELTQAVLMNLDCLEVRDSYWYTHLCGSEWNDFLKTQTFQVHDGHEDGHGHHVQTIWYKRFVNANKSLDGMTHLTQAVKEGNLIIPNPPELTKMAQQIWEMIDAAGMCNDKTMPKVECFKTKDGSIPKAFGVYDRSAQTVSISELTINQETLLHEFGHHITGAPDYSSEFTAFFVRLAREYMKLAFG